MIEMTDKKQRGMNLIEVMSVIAILGIFMALLIPRFMRSSIRSKQKEAKEVLSRVYDMQRAYRQQFSSYCLDGIVADSSESNRLVFEGIGVEIPSTARYTYRMYATANTFLCTAEANLDSDEIIDLWTIDQAGTLTNVIDDSMK